MLVASMLVRGASVSIMRAEGQELGDSVGFATQPAPQEEGPPGEALPSPIRHTGCGTPA